MANLSDFVHKVHQNATAQKRCSSGKGLIVRHFDHFKLNKIAKVRPRSAFQNLQDDSKLSEPNHFFNSVACDELCMTKYNCRQ